MKRRVPKDKSSGLPKKYLSGVKGSKRRRLAEVIQRISRLYRQGKNVPQSLLDERIRLGREK
tara:strand:- start:86 stop:271 length:186 start_codon:yes stop_codon:yes gene_type:complete